MSLDAVLAKLRREYAPFVRSSFIELEQAISSDADRRSLWRMAHRIAGTSGSYGFAEISRAARTLEDLLDTPSSPIETAVAALRRAIDQELDPSSQP